METQNKKERETVSSKLGISSERFEEIEKIIEPIWAKLEEKDMTTVDVMWSARKHTKTASEDMLVCYIIGAKQGINIGRHQIIEDLQLYLDVKKNGISAMIKKVLGL